jgi:hypothetical protein
MGMTNRLKLVCPLVMINLSKLRLAGGPGEPCPHRYGALQKRQFCNEGRAFSITSISTRAAIAVGGVSSLVSLQTFGTPPGFPLWLIFHAIKHP